MKKLWHIVWKTHTNWLETQNELQPSLTQTFNSPDRTLIKILWISDKLVAIINTGSHVGLRGQDTGSRYQDLGPGGQDVSPGGWDLGLMRLGCGSFRPESGTQESEFECQTQGSVFLRPRFWSQCQWLGSGSQRPKSQSRIPGSESLKIWVTEARI